MLRKIISGGQTGADINGVAAAKRMGLEYGGTMPKGFITTDGPHPDWAETWNMQEHASANYVPRTYLNVKDADATIRLAFNFKSPGEICTLKAINQYGKPYIDVDLNNPRPHQEVADWIVENNIEVLNVAGNAEKTYKGTGLATYEYLKEVFKLLGFTETVA